MDYPSIEQLLEKAAEGGGAIVCSVRCGSAELDEAQAEGRMTVTDAGYGFIWRPNEDAELAALRDKAAAFDVLSERIASGAWIVPDGAKNVTIGIRRTGQWIGCAMLAEAVRLAMEAEGER